MGNANCQRLDCTGIIAHPDLAGRLDGALCHVATQPQFQTERLQADEEVQLSTERFVRQHGGHARCPSSPSGAAAHAGEAKRPSWKERYVVRRVLGSGQSATVYEAFGVEDGAGAVSAVAAANGGGGGEAAAGDVGGAEGAPPVGRRVALKHFLRPNSLMLRRELQTLTAVGVHPNITRLFEYFEGGADGDALILEYCDGGDVYDFYAASKGHGMKEQVVGQILRQLLTALAHLVARSVDHRDVKPENLLLYGSKDQPYPRVKLADFGWAVIVKGGAKQSLPPEGVGSLWYAAPELNPPPAGAKRADEPPMLGKSDMWSAGVIAFLLLVGHNPFNKALVESDSKAVEREVIRLAALGDVNTRTRNWLKLSPQAKSFIMALIQPNLRLRPQPHEALEHPFIMRSCREAAGDPSACGLGGVNVGLSAVPAAEKPDGTATGEGAQVTEQECQRAWRSMDGFQQLCWLAVASAVSEPELIEERLARTLTFQSQSATMGSGSGGYLERLASELVAVASPDWFQHRAGWAHIARLAFQYLDTDGDGILSAEDLQTHMDSSYRDMVRNWIEKWRHSQLQSHVQGDGLSFVDFRWTLWLTCIRSVTMSGGPNCRLLADSKFVAKDDDANLRFPEQSSSPLDSFDVIDDWCDRYVDEVLFPDA
eukprot:TRINITY_DN28164_c0_g1_i1.p1 TRINITY_DN28164_c0_g1~~TRINITY_DN28164_c0_g1_i1.p1  ORF type:complete len:654 (+),score=153.23 TRINITY_DN28164_c0_g1_i1:118-2079(+)